MRKRISIGMICGVLVASRLTTQIAFNPDFIPDIRFLFTESTIKTEVQTEESANENTDYNNDVTVETETDFIVSEPMESITEEETETEEIPSEEPSETEPTYWCEWLGEEISLEDYELLCRTTYCESGGEPLEVQIMVCLVILNQYHSPKFADTIHGVVYAKNAFEVTLWKDFEEREWNTKTEIAVQTALAENPHPSDMFYFRTGHFHKWAEDYKKVGKVYFSTHPN